MSEVNLSDEIVFIRLTNEGVGALGDLVPRGDGFSALVVAEKGYGLWLIPQERTEGEGWNERFILVKWQYLQSMVVPRRRSGVHGSGGSPAGR